MSNDVMEIKKASYDDLKKVIKTTVMGTIKDHERFGLTASDVSKDMALVVAQAIREATKEDNNG